MRIISDLHIHSKYSRACSPDLVPEKIDEWARLKGVNLIATGDFTHPKWFAELREKLDEAEPGFWQIKKSRFGTRFIFSAEVACIYSQEKKLRRQHFVILLPSFAAVEKFNRFLEKRGAKLGSDGRPILGMRAQEVLKFTLDADPDGMLIPAHVWTPYFGLFGSKSGFDSVEEAFGDMSSHIYALETGLSSDPEMNWRISANNKYSLVSASDAHSLSKIGREANVMEIDQSQFSYSEFCRILKDKDLDKFKFTIEFYPEEGKYHLDGHADCSFSCLPSKTRELGGRCPHCGRLITIGVMSRVDELADQAAGFVPQGVVPSRHLVPLEEILADCLAVGSKSKSVQNYYFRLIKAAGTEFSVILDTPIADVARLSNSIVAEAVRRVRAGEVHKVAGYDGKYGVITVFTEEERSKVAGKQKVLF